MRVEYTIQDSRGGRVGAAITFSLMRLRRPPRLNLHRRPQPRRRDHEQPSSNITTTIPGPAHASAIFDALHKNVERVVRGKARPPASPSPACAPKATS